MGAGKRAAGKLSGTAWRSPSGDAAVYENCHANSNLSEYYDPARATARSRGSVSTSGITEGNGSVPHDHNKEEESKERK